MNLNVYFKRFCYFLEIFNIDIPPPLVYKNPKALLAFDGCLKVTHLDRVYQVYSKQLPYKGICIRVEEQLHFPSPPNSASPTLDSLPTTIIPPSPEHIMDIVIPSSSPFVNSNNPLSHLRDIEL